MSEFSREERELIRERALRLKLISESKLALKE